jgi:peptidoglycan/LPS O-acetylase OafA/YrhL
VGNARHAASVRSQPAFVRDRDSTPADNAGQFGDQAETSPDLKERRFRPDVEGLRAVAIATVVLYHAAIPGFGGGYVGVDVFFVISGFVITELLLRQVDRYGRPQFGVFYARRARRILPAAGLVAVAAVLATYKWLGFIRGNEVADDARWVAVFLGNVHFAAIGTNYFQSQLPPSPLQNYWSLAVEEQFYLVYPSAILLLALAWRTYNLRRKVMLFSGAVVILSLAWCIHATAVDGASAYFVIWTRAWELALGGFVAAGRELWTRIKPGISVFISWTGLAAILFAAMRFSSATEYPGWLAVIPVGGAALVILGGTTYRRFGAEAILMRRLPGLIGRLSYSIYLWHWPVLMIASQAASKPLTLGQRIFWLTVSIIAAVITYRIVENPVRYSKLLAKSWIRSVALGGLIVVIILLFCTYEIYAHSLL